VHVQSPGGRIGGTIAGAEHIWEALEGRPIPLKAWK
jgi:hypothetical protein